MTARELKRLRQSLHLSQEALANRLHTRRETIVRYESGRYSIPLTVELAIAHLAAAKRIPLVGTITLGAPLAFASQTETIELPAWLMQNGELVAMRMTSAPLWEESLLPGDLVIIKRQPDAGNGQTVLALVNGGATIKKYYRWSNRIELRPTNDAVEPLLAVCKDEIQIAGVVVGVIRSL